MPILDQPVPELRNYPGTNPKPAAFAAFRDKALAGMRQVESRVELQPAGFSAPSAE